MKYIFRPIIVLVILFCILTSGCARMIWTLLWHFRKPVFKDSFTFDGEYFFEDWSWKCFIKELFIETEDEE